MPARRGRQQEGAKRAPRVNLGKCKHTQPRDRPRRQRRRWPEQCARTHRQHPPNPFRCPRRRTARTSTCRSPRNWTHTRRVGQTRAQAGRNAGLLRERKLGRTRSSKRERENSTMYARIAPEGVGRARHTHTQRHATHMRHTKNNSASSNSPRGQPPFSPQQPLHPGQLPRSRAGEVSNTIRFPSRSRGRRDDHDVSYSGRLQGAVRARHAR
jgi:hypothetical protein